MRSSTSTLLLFVVLLAGLGGAILWWPGSNGEASSGGRGPAVEDDRFEAAPQLGAADAPGDGDARGAAPGSGLTLRASLPDGGVPAHTRFLVEEEGDVRVLESRDGDLLLPVAETDARVAALADGWWSRVHTVPARERSAPVARTFAGETRGGRLSVSVEDESGLALGNFRAQASWSESLVPQSGEGFALGQLWTRAFGSLPDGGGGQWLLEDVPPGVWTISASTREHAQQSGSVRIEPGGEAFLSLQLLRGSHVLGRLVDPDGAGVVAAQVYLFPAITFGGFGEGMLSKDLSGLAPRGGTVRSGADGTFDIGPVRSGEFRLYADASGHLPLRSEAVLELTAGSHHDVGTLVLQPGRDLVVRVVRAEDHTPIPEAQVRYTAGSRDEDLFAGLSSWKTPSPRPTTDASGELGIGALPRGVVSLLVEAEGRARRQYQVPKDHPLGEPFVAELGPELTVFGTVLDARDETPVAGASIVASPANSADFLSMFLPPELRGNSSPNGTSDENGRFRLTGLDEGAWNVTATHEEFAAATAGPLLVRPDEAEQHTVLRLTQGASLLVTVLDRAGAPRADSIVTILSYGDGDTRGEESDADGQVLFEHLRPATYQLSALPPGIENQAAALLTGNLEGIESYSDFVQVEADQHHEIVLGGVVEMADVQGYLTRGGEPAGELGIMVYGGSYFKMGRSDPDGFYELESVPEGDYLMMAGNLQFGGGSGWVGSLHVRGSGLLQHDIDLPGGVISVSVVDAETSESLSGVPVFLRPEHTTSGGGFLNTDAEGEVEFEYMRPGRYVLSAGRGAFPMFAGGSDYETRAISGVEILPDSDRTQHFELRLARGCELEALVRDPSGSPIGGASVFLLEEDGTPISLFSMKGSGPDGRVQLSSLPSGAHRVLARHPVHGQVEKSVWLTSGKRAEIDLVLEGGTTLRVLVVDAEGEPVRGVQAVALDARNQPLSALMDGMQAMQMGMSFLQGGEQTLGPLAPGDYTLLLQTLAGENDRHSVTIAPGDPEMRLVLEFSP